MSRVLFVDDTSLLGHLRRQLEPQAARWDMTFVSSAAEALRLMEGRPFDAVVSDLQMPGLGREQLLGEVRQRYPGTARVVLADEPADDDLIAIVSTAHQFVTRSAQPGEVTRAIERAIRLRDDIGAESDTPGSQVETLPSLPSTLHELLSVVESPSAGPREVAAVVERDVALSAKVLQMVNSSFFAGRTRITTLEAATIRLGIPTIRSLVMLDEVVRAVELPTWLARRWQWRLNAHALETGRLARLLAGPEHRDQAFCAGLLHECGQLVFAASRPELFVVHLRLREEEGRALPDIEREAFGIPHGRAGAYLLGQWGFADDLIEASAEHERPFAPGPGALSSLAAVVHLAHELVESDRIRICSATGAPGISDGDLDRMGVLERVAAWRLEAAQRDAAVAAGSAA